MRTLIVCLVLAITLPGLAIAQGEDGPSTVGTYTGPVPEALGDLLSTTDVTFDTGIIGIEHDGAGNLLYTSTGTDEVGIMDTAGNLIMVLFTASQGTDSNPLAVTTDGSSFYVTDTIDDEVEIYDSTGAPIGTFSVLAETPFPEGITYSPVLDQLFVVDGAFTTDPPDSLVQYDVGGMLIDQTDLTTLSNDGAAYDPARCSVWVYESGGDSVTQFSETDLSILTTFPGTATAGVGGGEGVAVIDDILYIMVPASDTLAAFDIADAPVPDGCGGPAVQEIPTLGQYGMLALLALLAIAGCWLLMRRRSALAS